MSKKKGIQIMKDDRRDTPLLVKIDALSKVNSEIIDRIKGLTKDVIVRYEYYFKASYSVSNWNRKDQLSKDPLFTVSENQITSSAEKIIQGWVPDKDLTKIKDFFNDNIDYTCKKFEDIIRLNVDMPRVAHKYVIFDCTDTAISVIESFLENIEVLQTYLGELEALLQDAPSSLDKLKQEVNTLNTSFAEVGQKVVNVNEVEQNKVKEQEDLMKTRMNDRLLLEKYPGCTLEQAKKEEHLAALPSLLSSTQIATVSSWVGSKNFQLLYKGTRDGFQAAQFHSLCNNKGPTLTIIKSQNGYLFGGYTPISWTSRGSYAWDNRTFIFTLTNPYGIPPTKFPNSGPGHSNSYSIYDVSNYGPTFGGGNDILISDHSNQIGFPSAFQDVTGKGYGSNTFTGSSTFQVSEIIVVLVK